MSSQVSPERRLWSGAILNALIILLMAPYGRALQHVIEARVGKQFALIFTIVIAVFGIHLLLRYVFQSRSGRLRRIIVFSLIALFYAWRLITLDVHVERFHLIEYGLLAGFVCLAVQRRRKDWSSLVWGFAAAWLVGMLDELFQWWWPTRVGEWRDVVLNIQSGALGLAATTLLFRDRLKFAMPSRRSIALLSMTFSCLSLLSMAFILKVHVFGFRHQDPEIGTFNSFFTIDVLLETTPVAYLQQVAMAGGHQSDRNITDHYLYFYEREAREHFDRVHLLTEQSRYPEALSEYRLTQRYYSPWLEGTGSSFSQPVLSGIATTEALDPEEFRSPVMNWLMVSVTRQQVKWLAWLATLVFLIPAGLNLIGLL